MINWQLDYKSYWKFFDWNMEVLVVTKGGWIQFRDYNGDEFITCDQEDEDEF